MQGEICLGVSLQQERAIVATGPELGKLMVRAKGARDAVAVAAVVVAELEDSAQAVEGVKDGALAGAECELLKDGHVTGWLGGQLDAVPVDASAAAVGQHAASGEDLNGNGFNNLVLAVGVNECDGCREAG